MTIVEAFVQSIDDSKARSVRVGTRVISPPLTPKYGSPSLDSRTHNSLEPDGTTLYPAFPDEPMGTDTLRHRQELKHTSIHQNQRKMLTCPSPVQPRLKTVWSQPFRLYFCGVFRPMLLTTPGLQYEKPSSNDYKENARKCRSFICCQNLRIPCVPHRKTELSVDYE